MAILRTVFTFSPLAPCMDDMLLFIVCTLACYFPSGVDNIWDSPYQGQVRLNSPANYTMSSYGRVEVYQNGQWGTVCNKGFSQEGADSACRQLGYTGAIFTGSAL